MLKEATWHLKMKLEKLPSLQGTFIKIKARNILFEIFKEVELFKTCEKTVWNGYLRCHLMLIKVWEELEFREHSFRGWKNFLLALPGFLSFIPN